MWTILWWHTICGLGALLSHLFTVFISHWVTQPITRFGGDLLPCTTELLLLLLLLVFLLVHVGLTPFPWFPSVPDIRHFYVLRCNFIHNQRQLQIILLCCARSHQDPRYPIMKLVFLYPLHWYSNILATPVANLILTAMHFVETKHASSIDRYRCCYCCRAIFCCVLCVCGFLLVPLPLLY